MVATTSVGQTSAMLKNRGKPSVEEITGCFCVRSFSATLILAGEGLLQVSTAETE